MEDTIKVAAPVYQKIAADIAAKIVDNRYRIGEKIYARSYLASQYNVSSETARRAICVLSDLEIVDVTKGSGVIIKSYDNAVKFVHQYNDIQSLNDLKKDILSSVERQRKETKFLLKSISSIIDRTERFQSINPFIPFEIEITDKTPLLDKSLSELNFWHHTAATIIAIKRNSTLMMSPGPYAILQKHDVLYYCGEDNCQDRVKSFLYPDEE
ncbi:TrkA C-terminal domain-containing protein [Caproiciproducens sp. CPB-2]|uniref:TrkA C-terminal domain-containing protein n=1 Tax=Caproiciproducens sp. CPB-2 TaxID=3030017 RepID=UPI0023D9B03F|nr:TrkA C-terminal domain-containing protein [Caproiciproducens sp. CPB-2]MDF1494658.1 TrkA C-terminal domain-containing protein [Caproiciproducens sp. CPB-2]